MANPVPPTIFPDKEFLSNFTNILRVTDNLKSDKYTILPNTIFTEGRISGLNDPINNSDAATYAYAIENTSLQMPSVPLNSIQYNNSGIFDGHPGYLFMKNTNSLFSENIRVNDIIIANTTISGLSEPIKNDQVATKRYVDGFDSLYDFIEIDNTGSITYGPEQLINKIIYRNTQINDNITDNFPSAKDIITYTNASIGTNFYIKIRNVATGYKNNLNFLVGNGITFKNNTTNIFSGYYYYGIMIITGTDTIDLYTINNSFSNTNNFKIDDQNISGNKTTINTVLANNYMLTFNNPTTLLQFDPPNEDTAGTITISSISRRIVFINNPVVTTVLLSKPEDLQNMFTNDGCVDFYLANDSGTTSIALLGLDGVNVPWTVAPNNIMTIGPNEIGWFMLSFTFSNITRDLNSATIYTLGIMNQT